MNCYFCQQPIFLHTSFSGLCVLCPTNVFHTGTTAGRELLVCMYVDHYTIGLDIEDQTCFIIDFIIDRPTQNYLIKLDYIPNVNPDNVKQYVYKLLKLKMFI